jgi:uncharacterized radical SAM superfamily Fe-S cluster-containing enzyme
MMECRLIEKTSALCRQCRISHEAELLEVNGRIEARVHCPEGTVTHLISSDPGKYLEIRSRSHTNIDAPAPQNKYYLLNYISITNACNFSCTVCGADAKKTDEAVFLSVAEILQRGRSAKAEGAKILHLIGGEPTLHPDLSEIVSQLSDMGFNLGLATNGYLLGKDPDLAAELKKHGLVRICLQFDSLDVKTLENYGRDALTEKQQAITNALAAGLNVSFNCTVSQQNLAELHLLLQQGFELGPLVKNMTFATAAPTGRFTLEDDEGADREQVITALLKVGEDYQFSFDDFLPLPSYLPWGLSVHPDCGVHVPFVRTPHGIIPLNRYLNMPRLYRMFSRVKMNRSWGSRRLIPLLYLLRSVRSRGFSLLGRVLFSALLSKQNYSLVNVSTSDYRAAMFMDEKRIHRCATAFHSSVGPVPGCLHFFMDEQFLGSRESEVKSGSC